MVIKIGKASGSFRSALDYNESKVSKGLAELILAEGVDKSTEGKIGSVLQRLENGSKAARNLCFHMSVNPSPADRCTEGQVLELIRQAMADLGYGSQPYAVFRHHDIERQHYHVVSVRCDAKGDRISSWHDRQKLQVLMRRLGPELGFTVGGQAQLDAGLHLSDTEADALIRQLRTSVRRSKNPGHFRSGEEVMPQIRSILRHALGYDFISVAEFKMILQDYGLNLSMGKDNLSYTVNGMDLNGRKSTKPFTSEEIGIDLPSAMKVAISYGKHARSSSVNEKRDRLYRRLSWHRRNTRSLCALRVFLSDDGVSLQLQRTKSRITGVHLIDHKTHSVFSGPSVWFSADNADNYRRFDAAHLKPATRTASKLVATELLSLSFGGTGGGSAGSAGNSDDERRKKKEAFMSMMAELNIADWNVADSNVAAL